MLRDRLNWSSRHAYPLINAGGVQRTHQKKPGTHAGFFATVGLWTEPHRPDHDAAEPLPITGPRPVSAPAPWRRRVAPTRDVPARMAMPRGDMPVPRGRMMSMLHLDQRWIVDSRPRRHKRNCRDGADGEKPRRRSNKSQFCEAHADSFCCYHPVHTNRRTPRKFHTEPMNRFDDSGPWISRDNLP